VGSDRSLDSVLSEIARTISEALGFQGVAFNLYRPAWDDFIVSTVHGSEAMCETLLGETYDWSVWELPLQDRFERRGAYFIPEGAGRLVRSRARRALRPRRGDRAATTPGSPATSSSCPAGTPTGTCSASSRSASRSRACARPTSQLDLLVGDGVAHRARSAGRQEAVEAARHRIALEQLLQVSSRLSERRSIDEVLQEVCDGVAGALDFQKVMIELVDPRPGPADAARRRRLGRVSHAPGVARLGRRRSGRCWTRLRGRGLLPRAADHRDRAHAAAQRLHLDHERARPHAWDHHWLVVPLTTRPGEIVGRIWADDPADRLLPSPSRLQALRVFANQAMMAVIAAGHVEQLRAQADRDSLTGHAQPARLHARAEHRDRALAALRPALRARPLRPRRLQERSTTPTATPAGDRALEASPHCSRRTVAASDFAFRVGGDEFALLLPETDADDGPGRRRADRGRAGGRRVLARRDSASASASPCSRSTARRPRSSSVAPTRRSTRPSAPDGRRPVRAARRLSGHTLGGVADPDTSPSAPGAAGASCTSARRSTTSASAPSLRPGDGIDTVLTADAYGAGEADELLGRALRGRRARRLLPGRRRGHDFYEGEREGAKGFPRFTDPRLRGPDEYAAYLRHGDRALAAAHRGRPLRPAAAAQPRPHRLHEPAVWEGMAALRDAGLTRLLGVAPGPANGFTLDVIDCLERFGSLIDWAMVILNPLEPWPGELVLPAAQRYGVDLITRVVDYGGLFWDDVRPGHAFAPHDHRAFRPEGWVQAGRERLERMRPIAERHGLTGLQLACQWNLAHDRVRCTVPTLIEEPAPRSRSRPSAPSSPPSRASASSPRTRSPRSARSATTPAPWCSRAPRRSSRASRSPTAGR
jgi:hypothetical protein